MFASPSYLEIQNKTETKKKSFDRLDYMGEYKRIKESVIKAKIEISVHKIHGTY